MSGITSGTGLISGINTGALIDQLIAIEARPRTLIQQRIAQLQAQQAAYLSINSNLGALRTAAEALPVHKQSRGMALGYSGASLGALITPPITRP